MDGRYSTVNISMDHQIISLPVNVYQDIWKILKYGVINSQQTKKKYQNFHQVISSIVEFRVQILHTTMH